MSPRARRTPGPATVTGKPLPKNSWERQYREGKLDFLASRDELAHYLIVAGYIRHGFAEPAILDVGCGAGRLVELMEPGWYRRYLGIDLSEEAIRRARRLEAAHARFEVADFDAWTPPEAFTVIVVCECLNYARVPVETLIRYARALEPGGAFIVSLYQHPNHPRIWASLEPHFRVVDATSVINRHRQGWDVKLLQPGAEVP